MRRSISIILAALAVIVGTAGAQAHSDTAGTPRARARA